MALIVKDQSGNLRQLEPTAVALGVGTSPDSAAGLVADNPLSADRLLDVHNPAWIASDDIQLRVGDLILNSRHSGSSDLQGDNQRGANGNLGLGARGIIFFYTVDNPETISIKMQINNAGNVRIGDGLTDPKERLEVEGNIVATGDVRLVGADCAEQFDVIEAEHVEAGAVVVISDNDRLSQCADEYDRRVAGVISGAGDLRPGLLLGIGPSDVVRLPVALTGKVYCRVDATSAPIEAGDLLTTSRTRGHAMKANDKARSAGAVLGKALRPLANGRGLIPILVTLQ